MTWAHVKETGSGTVALRLVIEGMTTEWVTDSYLEGAGTDDRVRRVGLQGDSFSFREKVDITKAESQSEGFTARIVDVGEYGTAEFAGRPDHTTWLTQTITDSATTIYCRYTLGWTIGETIHVGTECMIVDTIPDSVSATVTRAARDTIAQAHFTNDGENLRAPEITTGKPTCIEGRRCYVYAYGNGETGDGTRIFAGVCATDARLVDVTTWEITVDPLITLLEQSIGGDLEDPIRPRGIHYYVDGTLHVNLTLLTTDTYTGAIDETASFRLTHATSTNGTYFFETQEEFCQRLNDQIVTETSGWAVPFLATGDGPSLQAVPTDDGGWSFQYRTASSPKWLIVEARSPIDPWFYTNAPNGYSWRGNPLSGTLSSLQVYDLVRVGDTPAAVNTVPGQGGVPRGIFGARFGTDDRLYDGTDLVRDLYIGGSVSVASIDAFTIDWPDGSAPGGAATSHYNAIGNDTSVRSIVVENRGFEDPALDRVTRIWTPAMLPEIKFSRASATGSIYDLIDSICTNSPASANAGYSPLLTSDDVNLAEMEANVLSSANGLPFLLNRIYTQYKAMKLSEVLYPEMLLLGLVACMDEAGKISFRRCRAIAPTDAVAGTIDASNALSSVSFPTWERFQNGSINDVTLKTGYYAKEDSYIGTTFRVRDVGSYSRNKLARKVTIEPKSYCESEIDSSLSYRDILPILEPMLGLLGYPYDVISIPVALTLYDVLVGDNVLISSAQMPNASTGRRGITDATGIVIGREWHPMEAHGTLTVLVSLQNIAGYAPTSRITSTSLVSGTTYDITIATGSQPTGYATIDDWAVGDEIKVANIDSASPTVRTGFITTPFVTGTATFRVALSGALPAGTVNVDYVDASSVQPSQEVYCFQANDACIIEYGSGDGPARTFAP